MLLDRKHLIFILATIAVESGGLMMVSPALAKKVEDNLALIPEPMPDSAVFLPAYSGSRFNSNLNYYELTPKQYGEMFGHGNKRKRTNLIRCKHNAKLKKRKR